MNVGPCKKTTMKRHEYGNDSQGMLEEEREGEEEECVCDGRDLRRATEEGGRLRRKRL